jgi:hypothetical protein
MIATITRAKEQMAWMERSMLPSMTTKVEPAPRINKMAVSARITSSTSADCRTPRWWVGSSSYCSHRFDLLNESFNLVGIHRFEDLPIFGENFCDKYIIIHFQN